MAQRKTPSKNDDKSAPSAPKAKKPVTTLAPANEGGAMDAEILPPEAPTDEAKLDEAVQEVNSLAKATVLAGAIEIGRYLLREFFDDDPEKARSQDPTKAASIRKIAEHPELLVSGTTIFNSIRVAVDDRLLGENPAYKQLPWSHRVALLPVADPKKKAKLAALAARKALRVRELRAKVQALGEAARAAGADGEVPRRGRRPDPVSVKLVKRAQAALRVLPDGFDLKAEVEGLDRERRDRLVDEIKRVIVELGRVAEALG